MNPIEEQRNLINDIYELIRDSINENYETACCIFKYLTFEDGSSSIGSSLSFEIDGLLKYGVLHYPERQILDDVIPRLHSAMKAHTGGDWQTFKLTINKDGSVTTKFEYPSE